MKRTLLLLLFSYAAWGQTISKRELTGYWRSSMNVDSIKKEDTIIFTKGKKIDENFYFKSNHLLKEHIFFGHCGNKFFLDFFTPKQSEFATIASWHLDIKNEKTILTLSTGSLDEKGNTFLWYKDLIFLFIYRAKDQLTFKLVDINIPRTR